MFSSLFSRLEPVLAATLARVETRFGANGYDSVVEQLIKAHGLKKGVELAVGGNDSVGDCELAVLDHYGLRDGHYLIDVGCGSGRLTRRVARLPQLRYLGTDVSKPLINHARATCGREDFRFELVDRLRIPEADEAADIIAFFSVGTHLLAEQFFVYLEEAQRVLKPGGRIVLSFLDLRTPIGHKVFQQMIIEAREGNPPAPLNVFLAPSMLRLWAKMLGMTCIEIVNGGTGRVPVSSRVARIVESKLKNEIDLGQSIAVFKKSVRLGQPPASQSVAREAFTNYLNTL